MKQLLLLVLLLACLRPAHALADSVYFIDLSDAYEKSSALKALLKQVGQDVTQVRNEAEKQRAPVLAEIEALKTTRMSAEAQKQRRRELLLALAAFEQASAKRQEAIGKANEQATAKVDAVIAAIEAELKAELKASAIFRSQDLLYFRSGSTLDLSAKVYERLNQRLPTLALPAPQTRSGATPSGATPSGGTPSGGTPSGAKRGTP